MTKVEMAKNFTFLNGLSKEVATKLDKNVKQSTFKKAKTIIHKGQKVGGVFLVQSGVLRVYSIDADGNEKPIYTLGAGEVCVFSINCVLQQVVYPAWVSVDSATAEVISIPNTTFRYLYEQENRVRDYIVEALSQRIFDLMSVIEETSTLNLSARINSFLVRACNDENNIITMSHQDIASRLGTAREVVSRHLKALEKQGFITLSRMKIQIVSPQQLAKLSIAESA